MTIPGAKREQVRRRAKRRCEYCYSHERFVYASMQVDHIVPGSRGGSDDLANLCWSCPRWNGSKGTGTQARDPLTRRTTRLFNPRLDGWFDHFLWSKTGTYILGRTDMGRATVRALRMNRALVVITRRNWVAAGWHPPS